MNIVAIMFFGGACIQDTACSRRNKTRVKEIVIYVRVAPAACQVKVVSSLQRETRKYIKSALALTFTKLFLRICTHNIYNLGVERTCKLCPYILVKNSLISTTPNLLNALLKVVFRLNSCDLQLSESGMIYGRVSNGQGSERSHFALLSRRCRGSGEQD